VAPRTDDFNSCILWGNHIRDVCGHASECTPVVIDVSSARRCAHSCSLFNPSTPNDPYRGRTALLTPKFAFYIFIQQI
jgi:hypothetical protein